MKDPFNSFHSLQGALSLSFGALVIAIFHGMIDAIYVYGREGAGIEPAIALTFAVLFGIWIAGLMAASRGSRGGLIAAFAVGLLLWLGQDWMTVLVWCPGGGACASSWSYIASLVGLVVGGAALFALGRQIFGRRQPATV